MDGASDASLSGSVPSTGTPNSVIAPHWGDNYVPGVMCVATSGVAPNRLFIVEWPGTHYCCSTSTTVLTYEVILRESSGIIDFAYDEMTDAREQTMGIENQTGELGINACPGGSGTCLPTAGQRVRFTPVP